MYPRRFVKLADLPDDRLFPELETGLALIAHNATRLAHAAMALSDAGHARPARILASHAEDESGKFLILMDAARCPGNRRPEHLKRTGQHLARLLYAETAKLSPATFEEIVGYINSSRKSHYLDGHIGIEWVFRNSILYWREQALYVDYVEQEDGTCAWQDPDQFDKLFGDHGDPSRPFTFAADLVAALVEARLHVSPALGIVAARWHTFVPSDATHISEVRLLIRQTLEDLERQGMLGGAEDAWARIIEHWTFPLWNADLSEEKIKLSQLHEERERLNWE